MLESNIENLVSVILPGWWNWQTHTFEGRRPSGMGVQVPPPAYFPQLKIPNSAKQLSCIKGFF